MLSDERLVDAFEEHLLANYEPTDLADIVAGLRAVEAAVRADMQREVQTVEWGTALYESADEWRPEGPERSRSVAEGEGVRWAQEAVDKIRAERAEVVKP